MKLLGRDYGVVRGDLLQRRFTRPIYRDAYSEAVKRSADGADALFSEGVVESNSDSHVARCEGAMKLVAAADRIASTFELAQKLGSGDEAQLLKALRAYHFAANAARQFQQFELSTDLYVISAQVGDAVARMSVREGRKPDETLDSLLDWTDRSFMRAGAVSRETGSEDRVQAIFVANRDFRRLRYRLQRRHGHRAVLAVWKWLSNYGTSVLRIAASFGVLIVGSVIWLWLSAGVPPSPGLFWDNLLSSLGGDRAFAEEESYPVLDGFLRIAGFIWTILIGQLLVQRILVRS